MPGLDSQWPFVSTPLPCHTPCAPTPRMLQWWLFSPASRPSTGGALGHGKCSALDWQHSLSSVHVNTRGLDFPRIISVSTTMLLSPRECQKIQEEQVRWLLLTMLSLLLQTFNEPSLSKARIAHSPCSSASSLSAGKLFCCCVGAGVVRHIHSHFVDIMHRHYTSPPWQCDLASLSPLPLLSSLPPPLPPPPPPPQHHAAMDAAHGTVTSCCITHHHCIAPSWQCDLSCCCCCCRYCHHHCHYHCHPHCNHHHQGATK